MNVSSMDMTGGLSVKDPSQSQSRLPQWTHPNPMDNLPGAASPLDQNPSKHGMSKLRSPRVWSLLFCLLIIPISLRVCVCVCLCARVHVHTHMHLLNQIQLFATPSTVGHKAPLSVEFPRQEYWSGLPLPPSGDLPGPGVKPMSLVSPVLAGGFLTTVPPGKPFVTYTAFLF